jgi:hypothetical protein
VILSSLSTQYVIVPVYTSMPATNPTSDTVQFAFPLTGAQPTTWYAAAWQANQTTEPYLCQLLVGPAGGAVAFQSGFTYDMYVQITASPEIPVIYAGQIVVT